jgi:hypothetical protein
MHAILVHGWEGWPENAWFPWLRKELEKQGYTTEALKLPNPAVPDRDAWVRTIRDAIRTPDTILVGHSLGCMTILLALQAYDGPPIAGVVLVSGFGRDYGAIGLSIWLQGTTLDLPAIARKARWWSVVHGKNDLLVPFAEGEWLSEQLKTRIIVPERNGHLMHLEGAFEVPEILGSIIEHHV